MMISFCSLLRSFIHSAEQAACTAEERVHNRANPSACTGEQIPRAQPTATAVSDDSWLLRTWSHPIEAATTTPLARRLKDALAQPHSMVRLSAIWRRTVLFSDRIQTVPAGPVLCIQGQG